MHTTHTIIALLATITSSLALPTATVLEKRITPNTQSCTAEDHGLFASYSVDIGITYANGNGCNDVFNALANVGDGDVEPTNWQCVDDGNGDTQLWFNSGLGNGALINEALLSMYPNIAGGFNCPDN